MIRIYKRSQSSLEFILLVAFVLFFFVLFFLAIQENMSDKVKEGIDSQIKEIALTVQGEINLASEASDGYSRNFVIPRQTANQDYEITIADNLVYVKLGEQAIALPILQVTGNIVKGENIIKKQNEKIYLNS